MSRQQLDITTRSLVRLLVRYFGEDGLRPAMYMLQQNDFQQLVKHWINLRDGVIPKLREDLYYVAVPRKDGGRPDLRKAIEDRIFHSEEDAKAFAATKSREMNVLCKPYKVMVSDE